MTLRLALLTMALALSLDAQILRLAELNTTQIAALDRAKTIVLMPGVDASLAHDESVRKRQADWMKKNGIE